MLYDTIIIGAGPAGVSAGLYIKRANLNVLIIYHGESDLEKAEKIDNYYGFPNGVSGQELYNNGIEQAKNIGIDVINEEVLKVSKTETGFLVESSEQKYECRTIVFSTGNKKVTTNIEGIKEYEGKGISYCAICDAFFFKNKDIAVIGNGKYAVSEANELINIARSVTILTDGNDRPQCEFNVDERKIKRILGDDRVRKIEFEDGNELSIDGIFIALGEAGAVDFAKTMGIVQAGDNITVNDKMETNIPGVYACGNITGGLLQVCKAVYQGAEAGLSAIEFIRQNR